METKELKKLMVVDDDADILTISRYCLEGLSHVEVKYLRSGQEAIKEALAFQPDMILLDMMMPVMDGIATMNALKALPTVAKTPIVFVTAKIQQKELDHYRALGAVDIIKKPFDPLTLADTILNIWSTFTKREGV